jgi:hypothetical protein
MKFIPNGVSQEINIVTDKKELQRILDALSGIGEAEELTVSDNKLMQEIEEIIKVN